MKSFLAHVAPAMAILISLGTAPAFAQDYPNKPINMIISYPAGGIIDQSARILAQKASALLGQSIVPINQGGAAGRVALDALKRAHPDGYTIGVINNAVGVTLPLLDKTFKFNPTTDVTPIIRAVDSPYVLVAHPGVPFKTFSEFLTYAKTHKVSYGSAGAGGGGHLAMELLQSSAGISLTHVPYKGEQPALMDVAGGHVDVAILAGAARPMVNQGKLIALATTSASRWALYPAAPTASEGGLKDYAVTTWIGFAGPPALPQAIRTKLNEAFGAALRDPEVRQKLSEIGMIVMGSSPDEFTDFIRRDFVKWEKLINDAKIVSK